MPWLSDIFPERGDTGRAYEDMMKRISTPVKAPDVELRPFRFQIEDAIEVFPNTRHWIVICGRLLEGSIVMRQPIAIPATGGGTIIARAIDFDVKHKIAESLTTEFEGPVGIRIMGPAPLKEHIAFGVAEWFQSEQPFDHLTQLRHRPELYLHRLRTDGKLCTWCLQCIIRQQDCGAVLRELAVSTAPEIAELAAEALQAIERSQAESGDYQARTARKLRWPF